MLLASHQCVVVQKKNPMISANINEDGPVSVSLQYDNGNVQLSFSGNVVSRIGSTTTKAIKEVRQLFYADCCKLLNNVQKGKD